MFARFAEYALVAKPEGITVEMPEPWIVLHPARSVTASRAPGCEITVTGNELIPLGWSGLRNHQVSHREAWIVQHLRHTKPLLLNGIEFFTEHVLEHRDRIEPARGLVFEFRFRDDLEPLDEDLARRGLRGVDDLVVLDWILARGFDLDAARNVLRHARTRERPADG